MPPTLDLPTSLLAASSTTGTAGPQLDVDLWMWGAVGVIVLVALATDMAIGRGKSLTLKQAAVASAAWIGLGCAFGVFVHTQFGAEASAAYYSGYLLEKALSVDNIFVFALIFGAFDVAGAAQRRALQWGVIGALVLRGIFIAIGAALLAAAHWVMYVFGIVLLLTAAKMMWGADHHSDPTQGRIVRWARRWLPVVDYYDGSKLITRDATGARKLTLLALVIVVIEATDVVFAVDSIPAIFAITSEPFLVFTSNAFAILGLRALYFLLAGLIERFEKLSTGLAAILAFVGVKMMLIDVIHIPTSVSLTVIAVVLAISVVWSLHVTSGQPPHHVHDDDHDGLADPTTGTETTTADSSAA